MRGYPPSPSPSHLKQLEELLRSLFGCTEMISLGLHFESPSKYQLLSQFELSLLQQLVHQDWLHLPLSPTQCYSENFFPFQIGCSFNSLTQSILLQLAQLLLEAPHALGQCNCWFCPSTLAKLIKNKTHVANLRKATHKRHC